MYSPPTVSIIIPMYNSEDCIEKCLDGIFSTTYPKNCLEVIVVDNVSTDESVNIINRFNVKKFTCIDGNISKVRNLGASQACGDFYAFIDSDCVIDPDWVEVAINILKNSDIGATGSGYKLPENACWIEKAWLYQSRIQVRKVNFIPSGNFIIKASIFKDIGGFNERLVTCEDSDICERIMQKGFSIINSTKLESIHLRNPRNIQEFLRKEIWYGLNTTVSMKNRKIDKVTLFTIGFFLSHVSLSFSIWYQPLFKYSLILLSVILNAAVIHRLYFSRKFKYYFNILFLYYVYFLGRGIGITFSYLKNITTYLS